MSFTQINDTLKHFKKYLKHDIGMLLSLQCFPIALH